MIEPRRHRPALTPKQAVAALRDEVRAGRFDPRAVDAVLAAAGQQRTRRHTGPAGLTPREVEVLALIARGESTSKWPSNCSFVGPAFGRDFVIQWAAAYEAEMGAVEPRLLFDVGPVVKARGYHERDEFAAVAAGRRSARRSASPRTRRATSATSRAWR